MRFFQKAKDGGPNSPVDAFFLFEIKSFASIALLRFNEGCRESYHTHAFNAWTWFLAGDLEEENYGAPSRKYKRSFFPKLTKRDDNHRVKAYKTSWCFTIRGPWKDTWTETKDGKEITLTHHRIIVKENDCN